MDHIKEPTSPTAMRRLTQLMRMTEQSRTVDQQPTVSLMFDGSRLFTGSARPENSDDVPYPLTKEEALQFVEAKLAIRSPEVLVADDRVGFLNRVAGQLKRRMPFTNLHFFLSNPLWEMDANDRKRHMLSLEGGPCWVINPFTKALLECFGYICYHIAGYCPGDMMHDLHIATIVENAAYPGSLHLVDPASRRILGSAISLDFEEESPEYNSHGLTIKFFLKEDRLIWGALAETANPGGDNIMYDSTGRAWKQQLVYLLKERRNWHPYVDLLCGGFRAFGLENLAPPFNGLVFVSYLNKEQVISIQAYQDSIVTYLHDQDGTCQRAVMTKRALLQLFQGNFSQYPEERLQEVFQLCPFQ